VGFVSLAVLNCALTLMPTLARRSDASAAAVLSAKR
jgi:hypothetical protein